MTGEGSHAGREGRRPPSPDRLLRAIRVLRGVLLFAMFAAVLMVVAAVIARHSAGLTLAAKLTALAAGLVAGALLVLNLLALRAWRRNRRGASRD